MSFRVARRARESHVADDLATVLAGLALGASLGFLLGEWLGPDPVRTLPRRGRRTAASVAELVHDAQAALEADLELRERQLDVIPVGRSALQLRGWVHSRAERARAGRLVADAVKVDSVVNALLVRGDDDLATADSEDFDADSLPA